MYEREQAGDVDIGWCKIWQDSNNVADHIVGCRVEVEESCVRDIDSIFAEALQSVSSPLSKSSLASLS